MRKTTAIILAAGQGNRFQPLVTPKPLFPFLGKPMIEWILDDLKSVGIKRFIIVTSPELKNLRFGTSNKSIELVIQPKPTGMAEAILLAQKKLTTDSMIILNGNDLLSVKTYKNFIKTIKKHKNNPFVTGLKVTPPFTGGYFKLKNDQVVGVVEKPAPGYEPSDYVKLVLDYFPQAKDFISLLKKSRSKKDDRYEVALDKYLSQQKVGLVIAPDYFAQLKLPFNVLDLTENFLQHRLVSFKAKTTNIHKTAVINGPVYLSPGVKIMANAVIQGPVYLGPNVIIGNNCLIRNSIIEADSVVGYNTEIARSYVGPHNWFHCNYVGDSVIEANSNLGSGSRLANLRFDDQPIALKQGSKKINTHKTKFGAVIAKGSKLGINVSIMPGITIGAKALIGAGQVLNHSVKPNEKVF